MQVRFGPFTIDSETRQLVANDGEVHLSPKAFELLSLLLQHRPRVLEKSELTAQIWPNTFVVDASLNVLVGELRRAIGDSAQRPKFIRTVHGVGYAFCGEAADVQAARGEEPALLCWLTWKDKTFQLAEGDTVIGRDPRCGIWLDATGVSRRHARIHVDGARRRVALDDLGSTNGTFVGRSRVDGPVILNDGDSIKIGQVDLRLRLWAGDEASKTRRLRRSQR